jgi:hypothetical protein
MKRYGHHLTTVKSALQQRRWRYDVRARHRHWRVRFSRTVHAEPVFRGSQRWSLSEWL